MRTSKTTIIDAPADIVFLWLDDDERLRRWVPNIVEDETLVETPEKVGSTFRQTFLERGRKMELLGEITAYSENERMRVYMSGDMFNLDVDYALKALSAEQTQLRQTTAITLNGAFKLLTPLMLFLSKLGGSDAQAKAHAKLKQLVEAEFREG